MALQSRVWQEMHLFWAKIFLCKVSCKNSHFFCCQHAADGRAVAIALLCADDMNLPAPALREGVLVLFLDAVQVFCSNKPDSMWFLIDLEIGVLRKALWKIILQLLCFSFHWCFLVLCGKEDYRTSIAYLWVVTLSEYKGLIVRHFILLK